MNRTLILSFFPMSKEHVVDIITILRSNFKHVVALNQSTFLINSTLPKESIAGLFDSILSIDANNEDGLFLSEISSENHFIKGTLSSQMNIERMFKLSSKSFND